jgi:hypothetical protein
MQRRTFGYAKQGSGFGHTKIRDTPHAPAGLNREAEAAARAPALDPERLDSAEQRVRQDQN